MLGSLARWLRILDYDTEYERFISDEELIRRSNVEDRIALTKDRRLARRRALRQVLLIDGVSLSEQLTQVLSLTGDDPLRRPLFRRCLECNQRLEEISVAEAVPMVPPYVLQTQDRFLRCPACRRVFWAGTHRTRMLERLESLVIRQD